MFGIGASELLVILCVAVVFVRPKDLPKLMRRLGRLYARAKEAYAQVAAAKDGLLRDIEDEGAGTGEGEATTGGEAPTRRHRES